MVLFIWTPPLLCSQNGARKSAQIFDSFKTGRDIKLMDHEICCFPDMVYIQVPKYYIGYIIFSLIWASSCQAVASGLQPGFLHSFVSPTQ